MNNLLNLAVEAPWGIRALEASQNDQVKCFDYRSPLASERKSRCPREHLT